LPCARATIFLYTVNTCASKNEGEDMAPHVDWYYHRKG
jgi:hypothetical protein